MSSHQLARRNTAGRQCKEQGCPGEVCQRDQRRITRRLKQILTSADAREALARFSRDSRGRSIESIVAAAEYDGTPPPHLELTDDQLIQLLVELAGPDLLADREVRRIIADRSGPLYLDRLHDYEMGKQGKRTHRSKVDAIAERKWHPGKSWATHFVHSLRLPLVYAGSRSAQSLPDSLVIEPCVKLPSLRDFQVELRNQVLDLVNRRSVNNRAIVTLPTGAGKTRTAVEALLEWRQSLPDRPIILWIAQSDELCEQAVQSFKEVWFDLGHRDGQSWLRWASASAQRPQRPRCSASPQRHVAQAMRRRPDCAGGSTTGS